MSLGDDPGLTVMPATARRTDDGDLEIGGCALADLTEQFGTPAMIVDEQALRLAAREYLDSMRAIHPASEVYFATKAFPCSAIVRIFGEEGLGCDVDSAGEMAISLAGGVPAERMLLHGNAKTDQDISFALEAGIGLIAVDNFDDIERLHRLVTKEQPVLMRINPGVLAPTHESMATGHDGSKFGIPGIQVEEAMARIEADPLLRLEGLHAHIGSQILEIEPFRSEVEQISKLGDFETVNLGGGLGIRYSPIDPPAPAISEYTQALLESVRSHIGDGCRVIVEPGRSLVASSTVTVYTVVSVKRGPRTFVAVDGGMADNMEPIMYDTRFWPEVLRDGGREPEICDLVGRHCESGDRLAKDVSLATPRVGDQIVMPATGAYCHSMANNYNGALRLPVIICNGGKERLVSRRETIEDLLRLDVRPQS